MNPLIRLAAGVVEAIGDQLAHALLAHVAERHRRAGRELRVCHVGGSICR
jgi:hypothetical protein